MPKHNVFARAIMDAREEIGVLKKRTTSSRIPPVQESIRRLDPKQDPIRQLLLDRGVKLTDLRRNIQ